MRRTNTKSKITCYAMQTVASHLYPPAYMTVCHALLITWMVKLCVGGSATGFALIIALRSNSRRPYEREENNIILM